MRPQLAAIALLSCLFFTGEGDAFSTSAALSSIRDSSASSTSLDLCVGQGNQLAAAYNAKLYSGTYHSSSSASNTASGELNSKHWNASRFLARVFHIASTINSNTNTSTESSVKEQRREHFSLLNFLHHKQNQEVVKYPIVGFRLCSENPNNDCIALPTTSNYACRIPTCEEKGEELYGWYSPASKLDFYSDDYCRNPFETAAENDSSSMTCSQ